LLKEDEDEEEGDDIGNVVDFLVLELLDGLLAILTGIDDDDDDEEEEAEFLLELVLEPASRLLMSNLVALKAAAP
jgi:hypothetical protein